MAKGEIVTESNSTDSTELRMTWAFVQRMYIVLMLHLAFITLVCALVVFVNPVNRWLSNHRLVVLIPSIIVLIVFCPIHSYTVNRPINVVLFGFFTLCISCILAFVTALTKARVVFEALILTTTVTIGLTLFTFWTARRGCRFNFLSHFLSASLLMLLVWGLLQAFLPLIPILTSVYVLIGALVFSCYVVYDTYDLIRRYAFEDHIGAALILYIDYMSIIISIRHLLRGTSRCHR